MVNEVELDSPEDNYRKVAAFKPDIEYPINFIRTYKYRLWNFLILNLWKQFHRVANIYFLFVIILMSTPLSPITPAPILIAFLFILGTTALKDGLEDHRRYISDREINNRVCTIVDPISRTLKKITWAEVKVGDVVRISCNEQFPADLLLLCSSVPNGQCFIETMNLDGETNLKLRQAPTHLFQRLTSEERILNWDDVIIYEPPNVALHKFSGYTVFEGARIPLSIESLLLRGCLMRQPDWAYGLVVYTGPDTKVMLNTTDPPTKGSRLESSMNKLIMFLLVVLLLLATILSLVSASRQRKDFTREHAWYLDNDVSFGQTFGENYVAFFILLFSIIPLSLYVTMEVGRVGQSRFMMWDHEMYHDDTLSFCNVKTSNLNEELGQVRHVFSDKTGTLTQNLMAFRFCSIGGLPYGGDVASELQNETPGQSRNVQINATDLLKHMNDPNHPNSHNIREFLFALAICQTINPRATESGEIEYMASSPDELALVDFARVMGFVFTERVNNMLTVEVLGKKETVEILNVNEFNSNRKRMSVIVRTAEGRYKMYIKGADNVMKERASNEQYCFDPTIEHLDMYALGGLRTLVIGVVHLDTQTYLAWNQQYREAAAAVEEREEKLEAVAEPIEANITFIGATALEDKLQIGVPATIKALKEAHINVWILTGDKQETAINIGHSCNLIGESTVIKINDATKDGTRTKIEQAILQIKEEQNEAGYTLVMDGVTLISALHEDLLTLFLDLSHKCSAVIICRATPLQKSLCVKSVKDRLGVITLAIGDGANDVSMIQAANIGVGIRGKEGVQAVLASDYSFGQFRFLQRLLFVHGHWCYHRMTTSVLYIISKHLNFALLQVWGAIFNGFSSQTMYDSVQAIGFALLFTTAPPLFLAIMDQNIPARGLLQFPEIYRECQAVLAFNPVVWARWIIYGIIMSLVIWIFPVLVFYKSVDPDGTEGGYWFQNFCMYTALILVLNFQLGLEFRNWTKVQHYLIWGTLILFWIFYLLVCSRTNFVNLYWVFQRLHIFPAFWLTLIIIMAVLILPIFVSRYVKRMYFPEKSDLVTEYCLITNDRN